MDVTVHERPQTLHRLGTGLFLLGLEVKQRDVRDAPRAQQEELVRPVPV